MPTQKKEGRFCEMLSADKEKKLERFTDHFKFPERCPTNSLFCRGLDWRLALPQFPKSPPI